MSTSTWLKISCGGSRYTAWLCCAQPATVARSHGAPRQHDSRRRRHGHGVRGRSEGLQLRWRWRRRQGQQRLRRPGACSLTKNCNCLARARFGQGCRMAWPGRTQVDTRREAFAPKSHNAHRAVAKLAAGATAARLWLPAGLTAATGPGLAGSAGCGRQQSWAGSGRPESCGCISRAGSPAGLRCPRSGLGTALADLPGMRIS